MMPCNCRDNQCRHPLAQNCRRTKPRTGPPLERSQIMAARSEPQELDGTYSQPKNGWVCFHCGDTFLTQETAAEHFGEFPGTRPACVRRFRHFKGGEYTFVGEAFHTETEENMVVYRSDESGKLFARPAEMFYGFVDSNDYCGRKKRFEEI